MTYAEFTEKARLHTLRRKYKGNGLFFYWSFAAKA